MKVLFADAIASDAEGILSSAGISVDNRPGMETPEKIAALADCEGLVVRSATTVDATMMDAAPNLQVIGRAGSGVDNIDVPSATERGILVMNAPGENTLSAAEHAWAMLMAMCRNIPAAHGKLSGGGWGKTGLMGVELHGKTIGVLGLGRIGREVASMAKAFGMTVLGYDPFLSPEIAKKMGIELCELEEIWPQVHFLTLHTPLTDRTRHLMNDESFGACRAGVRVVNCARGGLIDEAALLAALESGQCAGAALDVFESEPPLEDYPLRKHPKVVCTPHLGASTSEAQEKVAVRIAEQMAAYLNDGAVQNAVNMPSVESEVANRLRPWQKLAGKLGVIQAHLLDGHITEIEIESAGDLLELPQSALTSAVLRGLLGRLLSQRVNLVNAGAVAREHGYTIKEVQGQDADGYAGLLSVRLRTDQGEHLVQGAVFGDIFPKVVRIDSYYIETDAKGELLLCINDDSIGRLAAVTTKIAELGINIADMALGRDKTQGTAMCALHLDENLSDEGLEAVRAIEGFRWARVIRR
ncbi:MAG: phosphoglycerate dehydrogenase [Planctomycetota bacterium]|jgi:D-3-phosphoglycerate dehydrogenase|nr:phosphoglycerate dehydrogenase [Planctomycetota bacterium]MDP6940990.1 phosphoglycerate dehydrogenase [Planctomycetota bacterium]